MNEEQFLKTTEQKTNTAVLRFREELRGVQGNRPSVEIIEEIRVNYYDQWYAIQQLGSLSVVPPREIRITVWDKNAVGPVVKAIEDAHAGLTASSDGTVIRATLSELSAERREELAKLIKKHAEAARIQVRNERDDAMKKLKGAEASGELGEDRAFKLREKVQKTVDGANEQIEEALAKKIQDIGS